MATKLFRCCGSLALVVTLVTSPALAEDTSPAAPPAAQAAPAASEEAVEDDPTPWILGGLGILALGAGASFGVLALSSYDSAEQLCPSHKDCSRRAMRERETAESEANLANAGVTIGLVALGISSYVLLTGASPTASPDEPVLSVGVDPQGRSLQAVFEGRF